MFYVRVPIVPTPDGKVTLSDDMLRLLVWVVADATIMTHQKDCPGSRKRTIRFKLSLQRKIVSLHALLKRLKIPFTFHVATKSGINKLQPYVTAIYADHARKICDLLNERKQLPESFFLLDHRQTEIVLRTVAETDGSVAVASIDWGTTSLHDVTIVQKLCDRHGIRMRVIRRDRPSPFGGSVKPLYRASIKLDCRPGRAQQATSHASGG